MVGNEWEFNKIQGCRCDGGFTGKDCSQRICPKGDDPLTWPVAALPGGYLGETWSVTFTFLEGPDFQGDGTSGAVTATTFNFYLEIDDMWGTTHRSRPMSFPVEDTRAGTNTALGAATLVGDIRDALLDMECIQALSAAPTIVSNVVAAAGAAPLMHNVVITFQLTAPLRLNAVRARYKNECVVSGCYPLLTANIFQIQAAAPADSYPGGVYTYPNQVKRAIPSLVITKVAPDANAESAECSNRGVCDLATGLCQCFEGHYGNACELQTILV
jgi:hypothetical protein